MSFASNAAQEPLQTIPDTDTPQGIPNPQLRLVADGFTLPTVVTSSGIPGDQRLFVVEKEGQIRIINADESVVSTPFLDISDRVENDGERGLIGLAFDPAYETNGYFYVNYSYKSGAAEGAVTELGDTIVARFQVTEDLNVADPASFTIILEVAQDFGNHNGGHLAFGPDGYLYIGLGDGGSGGDPNGRAQDRNSLLGSMLRINTIEGSGLPPECDPDGRYSIPEDNPFLFNNDSCDEVWAYGLRNPWRYSFDLETGDLYIADVGQNEREEVNFLAADAPAGANFGWRCFEGFPVFDDDCDELNDYVPPFFDYGHNENGGFSVTGGNVYRGSAYTNMDGYYFFGDFASTRLWHARLVDNEWDVVDLGTLGLRVASFGEGIDGELYVVDFNGGIYQITDDYG
ncbi:MAG: PQQ-dependent sugar dehydrogenase, partial [Chloroflexota bacterium]